MQTNHHSFHSFRLRQFVCTVLICIVSICAGRSRDIELNLVCLHLLALGQITCCSTSVHLSAPFCTFLHFYMFSPFFSANSGQCGHERKTSPVAGASAQGIIQGLGTCQGDVRQQTRGLSRTDGRGWQRLTLGRKR